MYEVEVGYPVVGYQKTKGHVEQGRVHQVHLRHTESTKNCRANILLLSDWRKHFCALCGVCTVFGVKSYLVA